jgi:release factor glutamine methyltransferase
MSLVTFLGVEIETGPGALVPRAETELLGRTAIGKLGDGARAIDVCCGTGNLACAIATAAPGVAMWALDLTDGCVELARKNVARLGLGERVTVLQGDLFGALPADFAPVDLIVCNPPYISTGKLATRDDLAGEPREAFDGGPYGLSIHQRVARDALPYLRPGGWLVFELGLGQERQLEIVIQRARGYDGVEFVTDDSGAPRVAAARKKETA